MSQQRSRAFPLVLLLASLSLSSVAGAQPNPFSAELRNLEREVRRQGRAPRGVLPLLGLWAGWGDVPPSEAMDRLEAIIGDRRVAAPTRAYASQLRARALARGGDLAAARREIEALGYVRTWRVIGPFDNEGKAGFARAYPPEARRMAPLEHDARYPGRTRDVAWREYPDVTRFGYVSFDAVFRPDTNVCGYAETFVRSRRAQALSLWVGGGGATRVWWNGEVVHEDDAYRVPHPDRSVAVVGAHAGLNRVLVKACATDRTWGFFFRVAAPDGGPPSGTEIVASPTVEEVAAVQAGHGVSRLPRPPSAPFAALRDAALAADASAQALEDFARFLTLTGADDPAEERARQLAARAADREPTVERLALAAQLTNQRGEAMRFTERAEGLGPERPATLLLAARLASEGPNPAAALPLLRRIEEGTSEWMRGTLLAAEILRTLGLPETARARVEAAAARAPGAPNWLAARAAAAGAASHRDAFIRLRAELRAVYHDDLGSLRVLLDDAVERGDRDRALSLLSTYRELAADRARTYITASEIYEAFGRADEQLAVLSAGLDIAPEESSLHVAQGRALLRAGQRDGAVAAFERALALRPQDRSTRELLEQIAPEGERLDESYAVAPEALLARRREAEGYSTSVLEDLSVNTVFESGLGSHFRQVAVQIHDAEGARQWRTYAIQFDPDVQRVDVRQARVHRGGEQLSATRTYEQPLGEPWYRIYYDTRALVVAFPDLEPGDVAEIQYRIDDVAPRNLFHDYYGNLSYLQQNVPVASLDFVLIAPASRSFYFNEPRMPSLQRDVTDGPDGQQIHHYHAEEIPALRAESSSPGRTELVPYLHVSTYRTWEEVGRWYWGLIQDQLYADDALRSTVRDLVAGVSDTREKVRRIYDWVIRHTRYVALEFGIHGFLPYRVPDIVNRGFGDCKDKASVIYTMLREAGIDARIVLTRTRRNGRISSLPASLSIFDHAIAYVPELDLYLDGTAEFTGIAELPRMDQGVTVLRVGPDDVELTRTPMLAPSANQRTRDVSYRLSEDGSGTVTVAQEVRGVEAPSYRGRYQAEGLRTERLARQFQPLFPGLAITSSEFENLDDFNAPLRLRFEASAPQLAIRDGRTLRVALSHLANLTQTFAAASTRSHLLDLGVRSAYIENRRIQLPRGWRISELPNGGVAESEFGRLSIEVRREGRDIRARSAFEMRADRIPPERYQAFRDWIQRADQVLRQRVILGQGAAR